MKRQILSIILISLALLAWNYSASASDVTIEHRYAMIQRKFEVMGKAFVSEAECKTALNGLRGLVCVERTIEGSDEKIFVAETVEQKNVIERWFQSLFRE